MTEGAGWQGMRRLYLVQLGDLEDVDVMQAASKCIYNEEQEMKNVLLIV